MRVAVKNMSGVFIHSTTPRKARLLIKKKKAIIESNNPFTIRLLFSESECGLKDSKPLNKLNSGLLSEKDITMCENEEINVLTDKLNEFYCFTLQSIRHILNSTDVDKVTWYTKNSSYASGGNDPDSFAGTLHDAGLTLFTKNHRGFGNFVLIGKQGFDILKKIGHPRFVFEGRQGTLDNLMIVHYIPSMDENRFIVSVYEPIDFDKDSDYKVYYKMYENIDNIVVGEIVDGERSEKSESEEASEQQSVNDNADTALNKSNSNLEKIKDSSMYENNTPKIICSVSNINFPDDHVLNFNEPTVCNFLRYYKCIPGFLCTVCSGYDSNKHTVIDELYNRDKMFFLKYCSIKEDELDDTVLSKPDTFNVYLYQILKKDNRCSLYKYIVFSNKLNLFNSCYSFIVVKPDNITESPNLYDVSKFAIRFILNEFLGNYDSKKWSVNDLCVNFINCITLDVLDKLKKQIEDMSEFSNNSNGNFEYTFDKYNEAEYSLEYSACSPNPPIPLKDRNISIKENTMCDEKISLEVEQEEQKHHFTRRTTHLIFGYYGCGKTTYILQLINDKIQNGLGVCVLTSAYSAKTYFKKEDKNLHIFTIADILTFLSDNEKNPTNIAKAIVDCFIANVGRFNIDTIAVDEMDMVIPSINDDYSEDEYFRELSKCCKENKLNLLYTKGINKIENDSSYHKIPTIFERFSDIITVIK